MNRKTQTALIALLLALVAGSAVAGTTGTEFRNLYIYNINAQLVRSMTGSTDQNGEASLNWDGTNSSGNKVDSGVYYYQLNSPDFQHQGRIVLMK